MRQLLVFVLLFLLAAAQGLRADCVECYNGFVPMPGHGAGPNGRRIIRVRIDGSWDTSPGQTNPLVWNAVNQAIQEWNDATDHWGNTTGYYLVLDQNQSADMTVKQGLCSANAAGCSSWVQPGGGPGDISLPYNTVMNPTFFPESLRQLVAHEIGHGLGLARQTCPNSSVMSPFARRVVYTENGPVTELWAQTIGVFKDDVVQVNLAMGNSSQCSGTFGNTSADIEDFGVSGGPFYEDVYIGGASCFQRWHVTDHYYWNGAGYSFSHRTWDYVVLEGCW